MNTWKLTDECGFTYEYEASDMRAALAVHVATGGLDDIVLARRTDYPLEEPD